ncbi:MAG: NAD(P)-dependent oxidoreductase [Pseudomonadota bacterium]|nr:NAD(P)-dependent oxidoreductase [Pseudomonadota bacterium]
MILAVTGGTGFVGSRTLDRALAGGHRVRALARRVQPERHGVTWIAGALDDGAALAELVDGSDAVIHVAGVVTADLAGFIAGNIEGTRAIVTAAHNARVRRFVHVSSLSAREPQLSDYGWSKAEAEKVVEASGLDWTILRPAAVFGPGDMEMRDLFRAAKLGLALLPPPGLMSAVAVDDLARLLVTVAERGAVRTIYEVDDGTSWTHADFARAIGAAVGQRVMPLHLPRALMLLGAWVDRRLRGDQAKLTRDRVGYLTHPDWTAQPDRRVPADLWSPEVDTRVGLGETARWYRDNGLL